MSQKLKGEGRVISVLSDGLGSGIKACVLSTMTATMAMNFTAHERKHSAYLNLDHEHVTQRYGSQDQLFDFLYLRY